MSSTTLYSVRIDGRLSQDLVLRNSHGGQPLVWDLLEDEFDPPTPQWLAEHRFLAGADGRVRGRWLLDPGPKGDGVGGALDRSYRAIGRTDLPAAHRLALAATDHRTWIAAAHCSLFADALEVVGRLASAGRVNHLPAIAAFLRSPPAGGWLGARISWSSLNVDIATEGADVELDFLDEVELDAHGVFEIFELNELSDLRPKTRRA